MSAYERSGGRLTIEAVAGEMARSLQHQAMEHRLHTRRGRTTNVVKHTRATTVDVSIVETDDCIDVRIADDGVGIGDRQDTGGFGLTGMQERIELIGGSIAIASPESGGTEIRASVPVITPELNPAAPA